MKSTVGRQARPSQISGTASTTIVPPTAALPEITSTRPSGSEVAVGYQRPPFIAGSGVQVRVRWSKVAA
jgi:hypothetical protein